MKEAKQTVSLEKRRLVPNTTSWDTPHPVQDASLATRLGEWDGFEEVDVGVEDHRMIDGYRGISICLWRA